MKGTQLVSGRYEITTVKLYFYFYFFHKKGKKSFVVKKQISTFTYIKENNSTFE